MNHIYVYYRDKVFNKENNENNIFNNEIEEEDEFSDDENDNEPEEKFPSFSFLSYSNENKEKIKNSVGKIFYNEDNLEFKYELKKYIDF